MNKSIVSAVATCAAGFLVGSFISVNWALTELKVNSNFENPLRYAVNDTNPANAKNGVDKAIKFLEDNDLTKANFCTFAYSPSCDMKVQYQKLKEASLAYEELSKLPPADVALSNGMIRLRESFIQHSSSGESLYMPTEALTLAIQYGIRGTTLWAGIFTILAATVAVLSLFVGAILIKDL